MPETTALRDAIMRILIVEDEPSIADTLIYALERERFEPVWVTLGHEALHALDSGTVDLVLLDVGLPDISGFDLCKKLRERSAVPVIFLTARGDEVDRVVGLEIGADDYVVKPFSPREVVARVRTVLKRAAPPELPAAPGDFTMNPSGAEISFRGVPLTLTRYEYRLLAALVRSPGRVFTREALMQAAWDHDVSDPRTVDTHIKQLRSKLRQVASDAAPIRTHRGLGYSLSATARE